MRIPAAEAMRDATASAVSKLLEPTEDAKKKFASLPAKTRVDLVLEVARAIAIRAHSGGGVVDEKTIRALAERHAQGSTAAPVP
jgi:hypothetical protein